MEWAVIGGFVVLLVIILFIATRKNENDDIDTMSGGEFESYCAELLQKSGAEVIEITKASGDFGADIIAIIDEEKTAVQCKRYDKPVGVKAVQEAIASMEHYGCRRAAVMTNSVFTAAAVTLADENSVLLFDREEIVRLETGDFEPISDSVSITVYSAASPAFSGEIGITAGENELTLASGENGTIAMLRSGMLITAKYGRRKAKLWVMPSGIRYIVIGTANNKPIIFTVE